MSLLKFTEIFIVDYSSVRKHLQIKKCFQHDLSEESIGNPPIINISILSPWKDTITIFTGDEKFVPYNNRCIITAYNTANSINRKPIYFIKKRLLIIGLYMKSENIINCWSPLKKGTATIDYYHNESMLANIGKHIICWSCMRKFPYCCINMLCQSPQK